MKMNLRSLMGLLAAGSMLAVIACAAPQPAAPSQSPPTQGGATPIPTTKLPPAEARMPTPTPVPAEVKNTTTEFASGYAELSGDWDKLHGDFQDWRQGLTACEASSVQITLHEFTGRFASITAATRSLPRDPLVRHLSDRLIEAAEVEEEALRALAENRQPSAPAINTSPSSEAGTLVAASDEKGAGEAGAVENGNNPASDGTGSVYEGVARARSQASAIQKGVSDSLDDLQARTSPDAQEDVSELSSAVSELNEAWDQFHRNYDSFRSAEPNYNAAQRTRGINLLVNEFRGVAQAARDLPSAAGTGDVADILAEAAEAEDLLLRILRGDLGQPGEFVGNQPSTEDDSSEISTPAPPVEGNGNLPPTKPEPLEEGSSGLGSGGLTGNGLFEAEVEADSEDEPSAADPAVFYAFDGQLVEANTVRRKAGQLLSKIEEEVSDDGRKEVNGFAAQHKRLMAQLDDFRDDYDEWRSTEGGCDRAEVIGALGGFTARFSDLSADVRGLPKATFLRPMGELLVEAADREHKSVRDLRNTWEPFYAGVYDDLDRQRDTSDKLRRQVSSGIDELAARYGLSLSD